MFFVVSSLILYLLILTFDGILLMILNFPVLLYSHRFSFSAFVTEICAFIDMSSNVFVNVKNISSNMLNNRVLLIVSDFLVT